MMEALFLLLPGEGGRPKGVRKDAFLRHYRRPVRDHAEGAGLRGPHPNPSPRGREEPRTSHQMQRAPLPFSLGEKMAR